MFAPWFLVMLTAGTRVRADRLALLDFDVGKKNSAITRILAIASGEHVYHSTDAAYWGGKLAVFLVPGGSRCIVPLRKALPMLFMSLRTPNKGNQTLA